MVAYWTVFRLYAFGFVLAFAVIAPDGQALFAFQVPNQPNIQTWYTNQVQFKLPFQTRVANPVEMHLYVSNDQGRSWSFQNRTNPVAGAFDVNTKGPGEYWYAIKTVDRDRRVHPAGKLVPGIIVVVDQAKPEFEIQFQADRAGRILANWKCSDSAIDPNSISIRYTSMVATGINTWLRVPIAAKQFEKSETVVDKIAWWPGIRADRFLIEAEIKDRAGNRTVVQRTVEMLSTPATIIAQTNTPPLGVANIPPNEMTGAGQQQESIADSNIAADQKVESQVWDSKVSDGQHQVIASASTGSNMFESDPAKQGDNMVAAGADAQFQLDHRNNDSQVPAQFASSGSSNPAITHNMLEMARAINTSKFALNYTVDAVGPSGVKQVQLWGTTDGGQTWQHWNNDEDLKSPMVVNAPGDGFYGFRIVVMDKSGLIGTPPSQGDSPDVLIRVDTTAPVAKITSAPYGKGDDAGKLAIYWETNDLQLGLRPITLSFSPSQQGPWNTIAADIGDTGYHAWKTDRQTPHRVFLRIDVVDQAGNKSFFVTADPIDVSGLIPRGRVQGVAPIK